MIRKLFTLSVSQPLIVLFTIVIATALGIHLVADMPIEAFPDVQDVQVQIVTQAPGQAPEEVERSISQPIERELAGTPQATRIRSVSITGLSVVTVTFADGTNDFFARQQVSERLGGAELPPDVKPELAPLTNAVGEIFRYVLDAPEGMNEVELRSIQDWFVRPRLRTVAGVADVVSFGGAVGELQVNVDPMRLARYGLTMAEVQRAVTENGGNVGGGVLNRGDQNFVIRGIALYRSPEDLARSVIVARDGKPIRIGDVAEVGFGEKPRSGMVGVTRRAGVGPDGAAQPLIEHDRAVEGIVQMLKGGNAAEVVAGVTARVDAINARLERDHPGVRLVTIYQRTELIGHTVSTVAENLLVGAALVLGILWIFLRRIVPALIVASVIPLSLLFAFVGMQILKVPANLMSLGAVDFGIIIDSAVVLVEALMVRLALEPQADGALGAAGRQGVLDRVGGQLSGPILFSKAIIICAFLPIFAFQRVEGRIFTPVALTLSLALLGGLVLTLTLVPALLSRALERRTIDEVHLGWMTWLGAAYRRLLVRIFAVPRRTIAIAVSALAMTLAAAPMLGTEFLPKLDEGNIWLTVGISPSASLDMTKSVERELRGILLEFPEVSQVITQVGRPDDGTDPKGPNNLEVLADLVPRSQWRFADKDALVAAMSDRAHTIPGIVTNFSQVIQDNVEEALSGAKGEVVVKLYGRDLDILEAKGRQIAAAIQRVRGAVDVGVLPINGQTEVDIAWRRDRLARYGLSAGDANALIATAFGGTAVATYFDGEIKRDVSVRLAARARASIDDLAAFPVPVASGEGGPATVPLSALAEIGERVGAARITREAGERHVTVKSNLADRDLGSFVAEARDTVGRDVVLPAGYRLEWGGQFENQQRAMKRLTTIVPLALVAVLALLFFALRAWRPAILVLAALPFALIGGFAGLALAGLHLSVSAAVGFIAVVGIAVQNSLIMVEQCLENLAALGSGHGPQSADGSAGDTRPSQIHEAILAAAGSRLRPILMTALMAGLGLLPMALSRGIGAETQRPFAVVIVGGVVSATIATLLLLPLLSEKVLASKARAARIAAAAEAEAPSGTMNPVQ